MTHGARVAVGSMRSHAVVARSDSSNSRADGAKHVRNNTSNFLYMRVKPCDGHQAVAEGENARREAKQTLEE